MLITVKFGDEQQRLFNAACRNDILLHHIKTQCQCRKEDVVELSDERGIVKNLRLFPKEYASVYLKNREALVLLRVHNNSNSTSSSCSEEVIEKAVFTPLLYSLMKNHDFIDALNPVKEDDVMSEASAKSRRGSSMFDLEDKTGKQKSKGSNSNTTTKKPVSRRGPRPPLRKSANTS